MQTGWKHDSHQSQREFERLRSQESVQQDVRVPAVVGSNQGVTPGLPGNPQPAVVTYDLSSPLSTITVGTQRGPTYVQWNIERFLTVAVDGLDLSTRINPVRSDTVKHIDFIAGTNITLEGLNLVDDKVQITINSSGGGGGAYDWDFITDTAVVETILTGEQVSFLGAGATTVTNAGNVITITSPAAVGWLLAAAGTGGTQTINGGDTATFDKSGDLTVTRTAGTITYGYTNPNPTVYNFLLEAVGTIGSETILTGQNIIFDKGGDLTVSRTLETITYSYTNPNPTVYYFNIQANGGATERIDVTETINFTGTGIATVTRSANTINIDVPAGGYSFDLKAIGVVGAETILTGQDIIFDRTGDLTVTRVNETITYGYTNPNPTVYTFLLKAVGTVGSETISAGQDIIFDKGGDLTVSRTLETITYSYTNPNPTVYYFNVQANASAVERIDVTETVTFADGLTTQWTNVGNTFTVQRPLTAKLSGVAVGTNDVVVHNFDSNGGTGSIYAEFEVADIGGGERRVRVKYAAGGSYTWVASDGPNNATVSSTDEVTWVGTSGAIVTLDIPTKTFTIDRPLQIQQDGTPIGGDDTITFNFDNAVGLKPVGHTARVWTEVFDGGGGLRRNEMWYDPTGTVYGWNIAAGTGSSIAVANGATVTVTGIQGITVTRTNDDLTIGIDPTDPPWGPRGSSRIKTGIIEFLPTSIDYNGTTPSHLYGTRLFYDIVHNWNLSNYNNFHLELVDKALSDDGTTLAQYRSGESPMNGEPGFPNVRFRNMPHWAAQDANTIRVWATMSRLKPTKMQFRYVLEEK